MLKLAKKKKTPFAKAVLENVKKNDGIEEEK